jgi:hypothetical protein
MRLLLALTAANLHRSGPELKGSGSSAIPPAAALLQSHSCCNRHSCGEIQVASLKRDSFFRNKALRPLLYVREINVTTKGRFHCDNENELALVAAPY